VTFVQGSAISATGEVTTGYFLSTFTSSSRAYRRAGDGTIQYLGNQLAQPSSYGTALSATGSTVVGYTAATISQGPAFRWSSTTGMQLLPMLPGVLDARAYGVSADGTIVAGWQTVNGRNQAVRWVNNSIELLGFLPGGTSSRASAINADGSTVVGVSSAGVGGPRAFRWTSSGGMQNLGALGTFGSEAYAISADGAIVVGESRITVDDVYRAFIWTHQSGMQDLGSLPGMAGARARAISGDGATVGGFSFNLGQARVATLWSDGQVINLQDFLAAQGVNLTGWSLREVTGLSADGRSLVGNGLFFGNDRTFIVTNIPAPGSGVTIIAAGATWVARRRRLIAIQA
jgi:probable HAF family extracellular repeat protein